MSADIIFVNFETGERVDVKRGTPGLLARAGRTALAELSLVPSVEIQDRDYCVERAITLGLAVEGLKEEQNKPDNDVEVEEMRTLKTLYHRALAKLSPEDQHHVMDFVFPEAKSKEFN